MLDDLFVGDSLLLEPRGYDGLHGDLAFCFFGVAEVSTMAPGLIVFALAPLDDPLLHELSAC